MEVLLDVALLILIVRFSVLGDFGLALEVTEHCLPNALRCGLDPRCCRVIRQESSEAILTLSQYLLLSSGLNHSGLLVRRLCSMPKALPGMCR